MEITKVATDNRGDVYAFECDGKTHTLVTFKKGISRGGHYHKNVQLHTVIAGILMCQTIDESEHETKKVMVEGESILILPGVAHMFTANTDAVLSESRVGPYEATDYEPYRKLCRPK